MKNIAISLMLVLLVSACSSGTTVSDLPQNVTSLFRGTFQNNPGTQNGSVTLNIVEDAAGNITGNITFSANGNNCLSNAPVTGNSNGFNLAVSADQSREEFTITTTITDNNGLQTVSVRTASNGTVGTVSTQNSDGSSRVEVTSQNADLTGVFQVQFAISNNGSTLSGTYVVDGNTCSNQTGSGVMNLSR